MKMKMEVKVKAVPTDIRHTYRPDIPCLWRRWLVYVFVMPDLTQLCIFFDQPTPAYLRAGVKATSGDKSGRSGR